jgi:aspartate aminotransferase
MRISRFASKVGLSETGAVDEKVRELRAAGREVFNFGVGQPDFPTPPGICEAGIQAIRDGKTRYTSPMGTLELRKGIAKKLHEENRLTYGADQILVSGGAKHSIHNLLAAVVSPDEEVLMPTPGWVSYPSMIRLLGAECVPVPTRLEEEFKITPAGLRAAITPRTVGIILNSPCNPTGAVYSEAELRALIPVFNEAKLWVIADEIYEKIVFDGRRHESIAALDPSIASRTAVVNGVSKSFSMTGWRIGYAAGPVDWIRAAAAIQSHQAGNACSISQEATLTALEGGHDSAEAMRVAFERRRDLVVRLLAGIDGLDIFPPQGTFYLFPRVESFLGTRTNGPSLKADKDLVHWLLDQSGVATVPGIAFGAPGHLRISFAASEETLERGLGAMRGALETLGTVR